MLTMLTMQSGTFVRIKIRAHIIWQKGKGTLGRQERLRLLGHLMAFICLEDTVLKQLVFYFLSFHYNAQPQNILKCLNSSFDIFKMKHFNIALKTFASFVSTQTVCQIVLTTLNFFSAVNVTLISPHSFALLYKWLSHSLTDTW